MYSGGSSGAVRDWLRFLELDDFSESFIDNGYDDLETVKLIEREDLIAIGVQSLEQQNYLLDSVRVLKEKGAAWVYLLYCDSTEQEEKFESDTEFCPSDKNTFGSSGVESCKSSLYPQSDETYSSESSSEYIRRYHTRKGMDVSQEMSHETSHFLLAAEVTPEHKPRVKLKRDKGTDRNFERDKLELNGGTLHLNSKAVLSISEVKPAGCRVMGVDTIVRDRGQSTLGEGQIIVRDRGDSALGEGHFTMTGREGRITMNISDEGIMGRRSRKEGRIGFQHNQSSFDSESSLLSQVRQWICHRRETRNLSQSSYQPDYPSRPLPSCVLLSQSSLSMVPPVPQSPTTNQGVPPSPPQVVSRGAKLSTPLVPHRTYSNRPRDRSPPMYRTRVRYLHTLGSGCESSV